MGISGVPELVFFSAHQILGGVNIDASVNMDPTASVHTIEQIIKVQIIPDNISGAQHFH